MKLTTKIYLLNWTVQKFVVCKKNYKKILYYAQNIIHSTLSKTLRLSLSSKLINYYVMPKQKFSAAIVIFYASVQCPIVLQKSL